MGVRPPEFSLIKIVFPARYLKKYRYETSKQESADPMIELIWKYLVGPVMADAQNSQTAVWNGVAAHTGYNPVNTVVWGVIAVALILLIRREFEKRGIQLNTSTAVNTIPFILLGGVLRFLEDAAVIPGPLRPLAITPIIYFLIAGLWTLTFLLSGKYSGRIGLSRDKTLLTSGTVLFSSALIIAAQKALRPDNLEAAAVSILVASALTALYYLATRNTSYGSREYVLVVLSQAFGGAVSMISLSQGYSQKQLLTRLSTQIFGQPGVLILKLVLAFVSIHLLENDIEDDRMKAIALIVLYSIGLATGLRVLLRLTAGI